MFRKELIDLLHDNPMSIHQIAELLEETPKDIEDDVKHLIKSLKKSPYHLDVTPAVCKKCGFHFQKEKLHKPGKCPICHDTWIEDPVLIIKSN